MSSIFCQYFYNISISQSAGEEDLKVLTPNNTPNAENRRVRVVKEVHFTEQQKAQPEQPIVVEEYSEDDDSCEDCEDEEVVEE